MSHIFEKRDRWGNGFSLWIILGAIFLTPLCAWSLRQARFDDDIDDWLVEQDPQAKTLRWTTRQFGLETSDTLLVSWDDSSLFDTRLDKLAERLQGKPDERGVRRGGVKQVAHVTTPREFVSRMIERGVSRDDAIQRLHGVLIGSGMYKIRLTETGRQQQKEVARTLALRAKQELGLEVQACPSVRDFEPQDEEPVADMEVTAAENPSAETAASETQVAETAPSETTAEPAVPVPVEAPKVEFDLIPTHDFQLRCKGLITGEQGNALKQLALSLRGPKTSMAPDGEPLVEDCFQWLGSPAAIEVQLSEAGEADRSQALSAIRDAAASVGVPAAQLRIGGRPVEVTTFNDSFRAAAWNPQASQLAEQSVIGLSALVGAIVAFSILRNARLSFLVLFATYFAIFVTVAMVPLTGGTLNFVTALVPMYLLVTLFSGSIYVTHYWRQAAHRQHAHPVAEAARLAALPSLATAASVVIGLLLAWLSNIRPLRDFGLYSTIGLVVGLGAVLWLLPAMIQMSSLPSPKPEEVEDSRWSELGRWCCRRRLWIVVCYALITVACGIGWKWIRTEPKFLHQFRPDDRFMTDYWFIEQNLAGIIPVDLVVKFDQSCQANPDFNFLERLELVRSLEDKLRAHREVSGTLAVPDFRPISEKLAADAKVVAKSRHAKLSAELEQQVKEDTAAGTKSYLVVAKDATDLQNPGDALLNRAGDELWRISVQCFAMSDTSFNEVVEELNDTARSVLRVQPGAGHFVTGKIPVILQSRQRLLNRVAINFIVAACATMLVMVFVSKHLFAADLMILPCMFPVVQFVGLISVCGIPIEFSTVMSASIAMCFGMSGLFHKVRCFRLAAREGTSREEAVGLALGQTGHASWTAAMTMATGLLVLLMSDLPLLSRFGWMTSALIALAVAADLLLTPALLGGLLGNWLIQADQPAGTTTTSAIEKPATPRSGTQPKESTVPPAPHLPPVNAPTTTLRQP